MLGLRFCVRAFSSCGKRGPLFIAVRGPLTVAASLVSEHRLQTRRLSNCGSRAQLLHGMWDLPRPGLEPVSPALADGLPTTVPPGKPWMHILYYKVFNKKFESEPEHFVCIFRTKWIKQNRRTQSLLYLIFPLSLSPQGGKPFLETSLAEFPCVLIGQNNWIINPILAERVRLWPV